MSQRVLDIIDSFEGWDGFLAHCEDTETDPLSTYDITDEEWEALKAMAAAR